MRSVLVTGTSTGIGEATAKRLASGGWRVYGGVRKQEDVERLRAADDGDVVPVVLDVADRDQVDAVLARIATDVGALDGLVNNAGIGVVGPVETVPDDDWRRVMEVNFFSVVRLTRLALPLVSRAEGRFVHIGSAAGRVSPGGFGPYSASKHALAAFNWSLRAEMSRNTNMTSALVEPGQSKTAIWTKTSDAVAAVDDSLQGTLRQRYEYLVHELREWRRQGLVGPARTVPTDADAQTRLLARFGRGP